MLWQDAGRVCRLWRDDAYGSKHAFIPVLSGAAHPTLESINRLIREYELKDYFAAAWALRPVELVRERGRTMLVVEYTGGEPLVDNRGALPDDVGGDAACGGGRVLPIPDWMTRSTMRVSIEQDVEPWFEAVCALCDDAALYESIGARARQIAEARYAERVLRVQHLDYFTSLKPGGRPPPHTAAS